MEQRRLGIDGLEGPVRERILKLKEESPVTEGICIICGERGTLYSGVCGTCFVSWAADVAEAQLKREQGIR